MMKLHDINKFKQSTLDWLSTENDDITLSMYFEDLISKNQSLHDSDFKEHYDWCQKIMSWNKSDFRDFLLECKEVVVKGNYAEVLMWTIVSAALPYMKLFEENTKIIDRQH